MKASQTVFITLDRTRAVPAGDKAAQFLLVREGGEISEVEAKKYNGAVALIEGKKAKPPVSDSPKPQNREEDIKISKRRARK